MNVNYEYYRIFYYVATYKSFTKAALAMGSNQPNITRTINCLEGELNCRLFVRSTRGVRLTPDGEALFQHVKTAVEQFQQGEEEIQRSAGLENGSVYIGTTETALNVYLLEKLKNFHIQYPGIRLRLSNHSTQEAVRSVKNGEADFAVISTPSGIETGLRETRLRGFRDILVGGKSFFLLSERVLSLSEVQRYPFLCLGRDTMTHQFYSEWFLNNGVELHPDTEAATTDQILALVKHELGIGFLPEPMAREALNRGEIIEIPLKEKVPPRAVSLVGDPKRPLGMAAQKLRQLILEDADPELADSPSV